MGVSTHHHPLPMVDMSTKQSNMNRGEHQQQMQPTTSIHKQCPHCTSPSLTNSEHGHHQHLQTASTAHHNPPTMNTPTHRTLVSPTNGNNNQPPPSTATTTHQHHPPMPIANTPCPHMTSTTTMPTTTPYLQQGCPSNTLIPLPLPEVFTVPP